jgi:hypothetical protein
MLSPATEKMLELKIYRTLHAKENKQQNLGKQRFGSKVK